jgi:hypothetical protein
MLPAHSLYMIKREGAGLLGCKHPTEAAFTTRARDNRAAPLCGPLGCLPRSLHREVNSAQKLTKALCAGSSRGQGYSPRSLSWYDVQFVQLRL